MVSETERLDIVRAKVRALELLYDASLLEDNTDRLTEIVMEARRIKNLTDEEFLCEVKGIDYRYN